MRKLALFVGVLLLVGAGLAAAPIMTPSASAAKGDVPCSAYDRPVYAAINPTTQASVLSYWATDVAIAADDGYTNYIGTIGKGAAVYQYGLWTMYRLTNAKTHDTVWVNRGTELDGLVKKGYVKGPHDFYASLKPSGCVVPVYRLVKSGIHRYTKVKSTRDRLVAAGWKYEKIAFYLGPPTATENQFTFAVVPDTQQEVLKPTDTRLDNRVNWMLQQRTTTDLQFVVATGDLANWDTPHHEQFAKVSKSVRADRDEDAVRLGTREPRHRRGLPGWERLPGRQGLGHRAQHQDLQHLLRSEERAAAGPEGSVRVRQDRQLLPDRHRRQGELAAAVAGAVAASGRWSAGRPRSSRPTRSPTSWWSRTPTSRPRVRSPRRTAGTDPRARSTCGTTWSRSTPTSSSSSPVTWGRRRPAPTRVFTATRSCPS